jgi:anti-sigma regulatory factor (Ser/Thr protein kinase)
MDALSFTLQNRLSELERLAQEVEEFAKAHRLSAAALHAVNLALDEIVTNIISYGFDDTAEHAIVLRFSLEGDDWVAEVEDDGKPFNPLDVPEPNIAAPLEQQENHGRGIFLVRKVMDRVEYHRREDRNVLTLRKRVSGA